MSNDLLELTLIRVQKVLNRVDKDLRRNAVRRAVYRALVLTDGQVSGDPNLAAALARAAAHTLSGSQRRPAELSATPESASPQSAPHDGHNLTREKETAEQADRTDTALVALHGAQQLLNRSSLRRKEMGLLEPLLEAADQLALSGSHALVREAALNLMTAALQHVSRSERAPLLGVEVLRRLRKHALGTTASRHVQCAAWAPLALVVGPELEGDLCALFEQCPGPDTALLLHNALILIPSCQLAPDIALRLVLQQRNAHSEHVRQGIVIALNALSHKSPLVHGELMNFALADGCPRVVGLAVLKLSYSTEQEQTGARQSLLPLLQYCAQSSEPTLHRAALAGIRIIARGTSGLSRLSDVSSILQQLINGKALDTAEMAAALARRLAVEVNPATGGVLQELERVCTRQAEGTTFLLPVSETLSDEEFHQVAFVAAAQDLPLQLRRLRNNRYKIQRGEKRGFRLWRLLFELRHFGPDKRQGYLHSHARIAHTGVSTVPVRQAEVTPTRVPGERRAFVGQSWGCFLPRVDDLLAACKASSGKHLLTPFGVVVLRAPQSVLHRIWLRVLLIHCHASLCALRDRALAATQREIQASFCQRLRAMGFRVEQQGTQIATGTLKVSTRAPSASYYFQALPLSWALWFEDALQYVVSPSGNTAWHLAVVVWLVLSAMLIRSGRVQQRFAKSKRKIALSVGGWGSRGKSGTERLKSALFQALHVDVVSKTTGCEAMLILARRGQPAQELFLYRPYDKATIWEQELSVSYAQQLGAQVFLWECMALNPEFVDILNREWMQDSITTITNAYPDHEDIMGPSGEDVARVISRFVPKNGIVLSSEDQMQALVRESALRRNTQLIDVDALSADLLPHDLLERFPYQEHPRNIALTLRLAETLGLSPNRILYDLADHVVPDLGVLKTFPLLEYRSRTLIFSNGMSANERAGFLSNWQRLEFSSHDCDATAHTHTLVVLNNRADRVARSRVFAELCARDISVDTLVVIGTNTGGMRGFLQSAARAESLKLFPPASPEERPAWTDELFKRLATPRHLATVKERIACLCAQFKNVDAQALRQELLDQLDPLQDSAMDTVIDTVKASNFTLNLDKQTQRWTAALSRALSIGDESSATWQSNPEARQIEIQGWLQQLVFPWVVYRHSIALSHRAQTSASEFTTRVREVFYEIFVRKIVILTDSDATGDEVLDFVFRQIPPGIHGKVLGCQNIKGTGLDFIYRFMSLQKLSNCLDNFEHSPSERFDTLDQLRNHAPLGLFDCQLLLARTEQWLKDDSSKFGPLNEAVEQLRFDWLGRRSQLVQALGKSQTRSRWLTVVGWLEPLLDHLDAIRRRKRADAIMQRLVIGHIDITAASEALRAVVARQKGGWLAKDIEKYVQRLRPGNLD